MSHDLLTGPITADQMIAVHAALAAAHADLTNPKKDKTATTPQFSYTYADLATVLEHVRPALAKQGLAIAQDVHVDGDRVDVTTMLIHASGGQLQFGPISGAVGGSWQQLGSAITYARRYAVLAALGIAADGEDDDGASAAPAAAAARPAGSGRALPSFARATDKQLGLLRSLMKRGHITEVLLNEFAVDAYGYEIPAEGLGALTTAQASQLIDGLTKTPAARPVSRSSGPDPDDPWAGPPAVDPVTGEVAL